MRTSLVMTLLAAVLLPLAAANCSIVNAPLDPEDPEDDDTTSSVGGGTSNSSSSVGGSGSCDDGFANCDSNDDNGCETDVRSDIRNCGGCGVLCANTVQNALNLSCDAGTCGYIQCDPIHADCDGNTANGCEREANTMQNCGGCDVACAPLNATSGSCDTGVCDYGMCTGLFDNCDNNPNNGCEADVSSDDANCGACGNQCMGMDRCANGVCEPPGCFSTMNKVQMGTQLMQMTRCDSVMNNGNTCINPTITYGSVTGGVPAMHTNNNFALWCQQLGCNGFTSVMYGNRSYASPAGKLFWCSSYDETSPHWCDWSDGNWHNQSLDSHGSQDGQAITSITCN